MGALDLQKGSQVKDREEEDANGNKLEEDCSVCVAVKIRPLVAQEQEQGSKTTLAVAGGQQVTTEWGNSKHQFTYDAVFGEDGQESHLLYPKCVSALVEGLFRGYNATVFAYGQTGSGKTYTMGSEYKPGKQSTAGVIPDTIHSIFSRIEATKDWQCTVRVGFVEIHKEEVRDLLVTTSGPRPVVSIRESPGGGVCLYGATEMEVNTQEEMAAVLEMGTLCRATASTNMNDRSSRSHAIFTITLEQRRQVSASPSRSNGTGVGSNSGARGVRCSRVMGDEDDDDADDTGFDGDQGIDDYLCAKMHLVDLAGSERAKRTKAEGARLKEGIHINRGLLSLGNVINAIVDNHKHIPYRDSKLTRLLQDSLGGNSRTVMIACVSPADVNFEETLNTLRYADRARHIRNKPKINRDPIAAQVAHLRQLLSQARNDNAALRRALADEGRDLSALDGQTTQQLRQHNSELELENTKLNIQVEELRKELAAANDRMFGLQADLELARAAQGGPAPAANAEAIGEGGAAGLPKHDVLKSHIARIAELERELRNVRQFHSLRRQPSRAIGERSIRRSSTMDGAGSEAVVHGPATPNGADSPHGTPPPPGGCNGVLAEDMDEGGSGSEDNSQVGNVDEEMFYAEMAAHAFEQEKLKQDMLALQRMLETKERKMADLTKNSGQVPALRQQYDRVLLELQKERDGFMAEKAAIMQKLQQLQASSEEERRRLEAQYKEKLKAYDEKLRDVRRKEREYIVMQKLKQRTEEMCNRLNADIHRIKLQKVALQKTMEGSAKQFAQWRAEREKELLQLRKQNRRNTAQIQSLEAMQAKQNAVLQRKIADAAAARKKLKELQAAGKEAGSTHCLSSSINGSVSASMASRSGATGELQPNANAPLLRNEKARREWVEMELDNCNLSYEYRRVLDGELAQRAEAHRLLKDIEKRLMIAKDLMPASPLIPSGSVCPPLPPANIEGRARLVERKAQLEMQVKEHNQQIVELQAAWEKAKQEEENRGGGAADVKRWTGVRNAIEARELLRTVFRIACDHKTQSNEAAMEMVKLQEEIDLMKVQLDAARKEVDAQQKRCAAIEASAATAMASPYSGAGGHHPHYSHTADEMDTECDDLLQELQVVAQSPSKGAPDAAAADEVALGSPDGSVQHSMELKPPSKMPASGKPNRLDLSQAASQLMRCSMAQSGTGPGSGRYAGMSAYDQDTIKGAPEEEEEEEYDETDSAEEMDDLDPDDTEWDPAHPTPPRGNSRKNTLNSTSSSGRHSSGRHSSSGRRRSTRPSILDPNTFSIPAMVAAATSRLASQASDTAPAPRPPRPPSTAGGAEEAAPPPKLQPAPSSGQHAPLSHRISMSSIGSVASSLALPIHEMPVLEDVNARRATAGEEPVHRLTVKVLKDNLAGSMGADGKPWRAGNKTREQLLRDYRAMLGLPVEAPAHVDVTQAAGAAAQLLPASPQEDTPLPLQAHANTSNEPTLATTVLPPPLVLSPPQPYFDPSAAAAPGSGHPSGGGAAAPHPAAHVYGGTQGVGAATAGAVAEAAGELGSGSSSSSSSQASMLQPALQPAPEPASPRPNWLQRVPTSAASPSPSFNSRKTGGDGFGFGSCILEEPTPSPISGISSMHPPASSPKLSGSFRQGRLPGVGPEEQEAEHAMTPLSKLYIQKAQEARDRTALLRQSISRSSAAALAPTSPASSAAAAVTRSPRAGNILNNIQGSQLPHSAAQQQQQQQSVLQPRLSPALKAGLQAATASPTAVSHGPRAASAISYASAAARAGPHTPPPPVSVQPRHNSQRSPAAAAYANGGWRPSLGGANGSGSSGSSPKAAMHSPSVMAGGRRGSRGGSPAGAQWK